MNIFRTGLLLVVALMCNSLAPAEDIPAKLPKDGWWVRYYVITKREGTNKEWTMTRTYSLVGTTEEKDQKCRWVEMKSVETINNKGQTDIVKFLVPEKGLLESEKPLENLVRARRRIDDLQVEEMRFNQPLGAGNYVVSADFGWGREMLLFPGAQRKAMVVDEKKTVEYQRGRLEAMHALRGMRSVSRQALSVVQKQTVVHDFTIWNDAAVAVGFVAAKTRVEFLEDNVASGASTAEWVIEDFGTDAKSAMPEK